MVALAFAVFLSGWGNPGGCRPPQCQTQVVKAVAQLNSENEERLREAMEQLLNLVNCSNIQLAIHPLEEILNDPSHEYATRRLAAEVLLAIGQALGLPQGQRAFDAVLNASLARLLDESADIDEIRDAIVFLKNMAGIPDVLESVEPLKLILNNPYRFDSFTRTLTAAALVDIAREQGLPAGEPALDAVTSALVGDRMDTLRAGAASALIAYRQPLPSVLAALEYAYMTDPSPLVQTSAYRALTILTNGAYETFGLPAASFSLSTTSSRASRSISSMPTCLSNELYRWVQEHMIIMDPSIKLEDYKCNPGDEVPQ